MSGRSKHSGSKHSGPKHPGSKHPGAKSVGWALVQAARLHRARMGDRLGELGLFAGQEQVVQALAAEGQMTMGELAAILRVRPPTASKTVSRLAALGLVERRAEPEDARVVRVGLTGEGAAKAAAIASLWDEVEAELLGDFDTKDRKRLRKLLRKVARNLAEASGADARGLDASDEEADDPDSEMEDAPGDLAQTA
ncbi:MarR family winged helix-turn-helix transcriptional regulator [Salinarimonas sp. NSM]|uniref:MarR family winged helix-turn-helix transcriptional regulator n=1 Tax=Salinarimonas sp. NSM TaxID=3458003 RepID=UPI0040363878